MGHITKKAVVTGAANGLGKAYAIEFARLGYDLVLIDKDREQLEILSGSIAENNKIKIEVLFVDLACVKNIDSLQKHVAEFKNIEILVNCAGFGADGFFCDIAWEKHLEMINVQVVATTSLIRAVLPQMIEQKKGYIINVSSLSGLIFAKGSVLYPTLKNYIKMLSQAVHSEVKEHGVVVQALLPGFTNGTNFYTNRNVSVSKKVPKIFWTDAKVVVQKSLKFLDSKKAICVPGIANKIIYLLLKLKVINCLFWFVSKIR